MISLWHHIWPGWDAVYPNLVASAIYGPPIVLAQHLLSRWWHKRKDRPIHAKLDFLTALALGDTDQKPPAGL